jgi:hypothetical protein
MTDTTQPLWYQLGYALERTRREPTRERLRDLGRKLNAFRSEDQRKVSPGRAGKSGKPSPASESRDGGEDVWGGLAATAGGALVAAVLRGWPARREPGAAAVARAAAAGAAASVLVELGRRVLEGGESVQVENLPDRLLSGAARGLVFGAVAEPRLPGPPILRGLTWGGAEFLLSPLGGLPRFLLRHTPYGRLPLVQSVVKPEDHGEGDLLEHLVFGIALALLAGSS